VCVCQMITKLAKKARERRKLRKRQKAKRKREEAREPDCRNKRRGFEMF
jgi:hypothetical protein